MLTSFQFTQSALPSRLVPTFPCDSCCPMVVQAHLMPCEAGASLHYITAATGCHGNAHGHYRTVLECVCVFVCAENMTVYVYLSVCWMCIDTGFPQAGEISESLWIWRKNKGLKMTSENKFLHCSGISASYLGKPCDVDLCCGSNMENDDLYQIYLVW